MGFPLLHEVFVINWKPKVTWEQLRGHLCPTLWPVEVLGVGQVIVQVSHQS